MKKSYHYQLLIIFLLLNIKFGFSQISTEETPVSFSLKQLQQSKANIPLIIMPKIDLKQLQKEDEEEV